MATEAAGSFLLHFLFGVLFLVSPEGGVVSLELLPSSSRVILPQNSSYSTVCSGWSDVVWSLPGDSVVGVSVEASGSSSSVLRVSGASWRTSGKYTCSEPDSGLTRTLDLFVPGTGPSEWFVPSSDSVVMRRTREALVPCSVSDPDLEVSLWERSGPDRIRVSLVRFDPALGVTAELNDSSYVCIAHRDHQEALSQVYYVYSTVGPEEVLVDLSSSAVVLRSGDPLEVNCTVSESENVYFTWEFPRQRQQQGAESEPGVEPLTEFLLNQVRSFINITDTRREDSGLYVCSVEESVQKQKIQKTLNITVLDRGFVDLDPSESTLVQTLVHHTVALSLHVRAFPAPNITWSITTATGSSIITPATGDPNITTATASASASTTRLSHTRFLGVLRLEEVQMNQTGSYVATVSNEDDVKEVEFRLEVRAPSRILALSEVGVASVLCVSEGAPPPRVTWLLCPAHLRCADVGWSNVSDSLGASVTENSTEKQGLTEVHSVLSLRALDSVSAVRCESRNSLGRRAWDLRLLSSSLWSQVKVLAAVLVLVVLAVIFLILLIVLWRKKPRWALGWRMLDSISPDAPEQSHASFCESELTYEEQWEVPQERVQLGSVLSSGSFGRIVEATVQGWRRHTCTVLLPTGGAVHSLLSDLKILIHVGPHLNLLNLRGAVTRHRPLMVITEWCCYGDLSSYLRKHRHACSSAPSDRYMDMSSECVAMKQLCVSEYERLHNTDPQGALSSHDVSVSDLLFFCFQTAAALDFLSARNVVHRDVGARNVVVCEEKVVKICDFGFGRNVNERSEYDKRERARLPVKWMSPESIFLCVYTTQSDVWSYGVLLWEIYSLGELPFPDVSVSQFCSDLKNGKRLEKPQLCPTEIYDLMCVCWEKSPGSRPSFSSLVEALGKMLHPQTLQKYSTLTEQFHSDLVQTRDQTEPGPDQTRTEPGPDQTRTEPGPDQTRTEPGPDQTRTEPGPDQTRTEPGPDQTRTEHGPDQTRNDPGLDQGPDQDWAGPQVTVHLSGEEPNATVPTHSDEVTAVSVVAMETRGDAALDADEDKLALSEEQEVTSSAQEESCV